MMLRYKVLTLYTNAVLAMLLSLTADVSAQLAPADRPPKPPPPPPEIRFAGPNAAGGSRVPAYFKGQLIPVARQQAAQSNSRRSINTHQAVSQAGFPQSQKTVQPQHGYGQYQSQAQHSTEPQVGYPQRPTTSAAASRDGPITSHPAVSQAGNDQSKIQTHAGSADPLRTIHTQTGYTQPRAAYAQPQRTAQVGYAHSQTIPTASQDTSITSHRAVSQDGYNWRTGTIGSPVGITKSQKTIQLNSPYTTQRTIQPEEPLAQPQRIAQSEINLHQPHTKNRPRTRIVQLPRKIQHKPPFGEHLRATFRAPVQIVATGNKSTTVCPRESGNPQMPAEGRGAQFGGPQPAPAPSQIEVTGNKSPTVS